MVASKRRTHQKKASDIKVEHVPLSVIRPSPENNHLYRPVCEDDPKIIELAKSILEHGQKEDIVVSLDGWILSGHRRHAACKVAGLKTVRVRYENIFRTDDIDKFVVLLREYNRQRHKNLAEQAREEIASLDPDEAYDRLIEHRRGSAEIESAPMQIVGAMSRKRISEAKFPLLQAVQRVIAEEREFWPLSDRAIHYRMLNDPPLTHANKPDSTYRNDQRSYRKLVDILTRARLTGEIPWQAIADATRPVTTWQVHDGPAGFVSQQMGDLLKNYWRDLLQSQPNHVEIVGEKNTVDSILRTVAMEYCAPLTTGRGYCSLPPRWQMAQRYRKSGKTKLVLLLLSDFDPDGDEIAQSFARSMRDDFGIADIHPVRVALTHEQVEEFQLPAVMKAKRSSVHYNKFTASNGDDVFELEALPAKELQRLLREALDDVLDIEAFNAEQEAEHADAAFIAGMRTTVHQALMEAMPDVEDN